MTPTFSHGKNTKILVDGVDVSEWFKTWDAKRDIATAETSTIGNEAKTYIPGLGDGTFSLDTGLGVSRSVITKYAEARSYGKKIGRHTEKWLKTVLNSGKVPLRKLLEEEIMGTKIPPTRITTDTILLRVLS